jgi:hypothetical protein
MLSAAACVNRVDPPRSPPSPASAMPQTEPEDRPALLGAHVLYDAPPPELPAAGRDEVQLVFSAPLDPTSIVAASFLVLGAEGRRATPARAVLAPADELDEGRAIDVHGDFGEGAPTDVRVIGHLRTKDGRSLRGAVASVLPLWEPVRLLLAYRVVPAEGRCASASAAIRTWWSQPLAAPLSDAQIVRFEVQRSDGVAFAPRMADDHTRAPPPSVDAQPQPEDPAPAALPDDAVLDLCFDEGAVGGVLSVPAGVVIGRSGRAADAQTSRIVDGAAGEGE